MKQVRVSRLARRDVEAIRDWIAEEDTAAAIAVLESLKKRMKMLGEMNEMGRSRPDFLPGMRSVVVRPFIILYRVGDDAVDIIRVLDGRRDLPNILK